MSLTKSEIAYIAVILVLVAASLYFMAPFLFRPASGPSGSIITTPQDYPTVNITILTSTNCKSLCNLDNVRDRLTSLFVNVNFTTLNVETSEGRQLADRYGISLVPAYFVSVPQADKSPAFPSMRAALKKLDATYYLLDSLEAKSGFLFNNAPSAGPSIVMYISAFETNSLRTANATYSLLNERFRGEVNLTVHYVIRRENNSFISIDKYVGLREAVLQVCMRRANTSSFGGQWCRTRQILNCTSPENFDPAFCAQVWTLCAGSYSLDERNVSICLSAQNRSILEQEAAATDIIGGVPTLIIGNRYVMAGLTDQFRLLTGLCDVYSRRLNGCVVTPRS